MSIVVPAPDQPTMAAALRRLAGLDLLDRAAAGRRRPDAPPVVTFSELLAYVHGHCPGRDARVQDAIRRNAAVRRRYHTLLAGQEAARLPLLRAAASPGAELKRGFELDGKRGLVTITPLTAKPGHVLLSITFEAPPRLRSLAVAVPEGHPRTTELAGLRLRFNERAAEPVELVLRQDDPIVAALFDPDVTIAVTTTAP